MSVSFSITLPFPPSANNLYRNYGNRRVMTERYAAWRNEAAWAIRAAVGPNKVRGPYALYIKAGKPDERRRDLGNLWKAVEDSLVKGGAVDDDSECQRQEGEWDADPDLKGKVRLLVLSTGARL